MKVTKRQLKKLIAEETNNVIEEGFLDSIMGFFGKMSDQDKQLVSKLYDAAGEMMGSQAYDDLWHYPWMTTFDEWSEQDAELAQQDLDAVRSLYTPVMDAQRQIYRNGTRAAQKAADQLLDYDKGPLGKFGRAAIRLGGGNSFEEKQQQMGVRAFDAELKGVESAREAMKKINQLRAAMKKATAGRKGREAAASMEVVIQKSRETLGKIALYVYDKDWWQLDDNEKTEAFEVFAASSRQRADTLGEAGTTDHDPRTLRDASPNAGVAKQALQRAKEVSDEGGRAMTSWTKFIMSALDAQEAGRANESIDRHRLKKVIREELAKVLQGK